MIVAVNPLPEAGLLKFRNPQTVRGLVGRGTALADHFLQIRVGGDLALFQAIGSLLVEWGAVDKEFLGAHTEGYDDVRRESVHTGLVHCGAVDRSHPRRDRRSWRGCSRTRPRRSCAGRWG